MELVSHLFNLYNKNGTVKLFILQKAVIFGIVYLLQCVLRFVHNFTKLL